MPGARVVPLEIESTDELDDLALVEALRRGAPGAERLAWHRLGPMVARTIYRLGGPGCDEEDLSQEVFLRFFRKVGRLREPGSVRAFLTGICIRVVRREVRRRWLRRWLRLTSRGDVPDVAGPEGDPESRQVVQHYYGVLEQLSAEARSLFVARHIEGLTLADVASLHGLSVSTAQRKLARERARIAALAKSDPVLRARNLVHHRPGPRTTTGSIACREWPARPPPTWRRTRARRRAGRVWWTSGRIGPSARSGVRSRSRR